VPVSGSDAIARSVSAETRGFASRDASGSPACIDDRPGRLCDKLAAAAPERAARGKESVMSVYRVTEIIGTSSTSWEDAAAEAIRTAAGTLRDLRVAEVVKQDIHLDEGGAITYRIKLQLSFKYESDH
jgi:dodecin